MTMTLNQFNAAILKSGGKFAGLHHYTCSKGFKSDVTLRLGQSYGSQLQAALEESEEAMTIEDEFGDRIIDQHVRSVWCKKHRATVEEFDAAFLEKRQSWKASLEGNQPRRNRSTVPLAETLGKVEVAQINKDGTGINIRCTVRMTSRKGYEEHNATVEQTSKKIEPKSGKARVKAALQRKFMNIKTFTLNAESFKRFDMCGLTIMPEHISPMLNEWRQKQTA